MKNCFTVKELAQYLRLAPSHVDDHGEIRIYPDHIDPDHVPVLVHNNHDLGSNRGHTIRNLSTGAQTIAPLPRKGTSFCPFKSLPSSCFEFSHWIPGIQGSTIRLYPNQYRFFRKATAR